MLPFVFQTQFGINYEKKKAASQIDMLSPEESQQAEREAKATTWRQTVGGLNHGRLYGTWDLASHFSHGMYEGYYSSQMPSSSGSGASVSSDAALRQVMDELHREREARQREREAWQKEHEAQQKFTKDQQREIENVSMTTEWFNSNVSKMMKWFNSMKASQSRQPGVESSRSQHVHPDYVEDDEEEDDDDGDDD